MKQYEKDGNVALVLASEMVMSKSNRAHLCGWHKLVCEKVKTSAESPGTGELKYDLFRRVSGGFRNGKQTKKVTRFERVDRNILRTLA